MKKLTAFLFLIAVVVSTSHAGTTQSFPFFKELTPPTEAKRNVGSFEFDEEILLQTDMNYSNVRILDTENTETPFQIRNKRRKKTVIREYSVAMQKDSLKELPDNKIEIILSQKTSDGGTIANPTVITFSTAMKNFEKQITVYGSNDKTAWTTIVENKPIFDYSRFFDISNKRINIANAKYRHYKLAISNITQKHDSPIVNIAKETRVEGLYSKIEKASFIRKDFRIEKIEFFAKKAFEAKTTSVTREYTIKKMQSENTKEGETTVTFSTAYVPLSKLTVITDNSNFSRTAKIEATNNKDSSFSWKYISTANITKIRIGRFKQDKTDIRFNQPQRFKHYRMTIVNLDSPPLAIKSLKAEGEVHEAIFFCSPSKKYHIAYGAKEIPSPRYDISDVLRKTHGEDTDNYSLGSEQENQDHKKTSKKFSLNSQTLLTVVIVIMVGALLWVIAAAAKKIDIPDTE